MTTTETTRGNSFASLTHRERGFLKVNGGNGAAKRTMGGQKGGEKDNEVKGAAKRTMGQRGDVISCFVDFLP